MTKNELKLVCSLLAKMSFWKFGLCLVILAVALSDQKPFDEPDAQPIRDFELLRIIPKNLNKFISKEQLQSLVDAVKNKSVDAKLIINDEMDRWLENLNSEIISQGADPVELEDQGFEFEFKWIFVTYRGEMTLKHGWCQGLATLERVKDCTLEIVGKKLQLKLVATFTDLMFSYDYTAKLMGIGPKGGIDGAIRDSQFTITVDVDLEECEATLASYKLNKPGKINLKFTGNPWGDIIMNILSKAATTFLKPFFRIFITGWIQSGVTTVLEVVNESVLPEMGICSVIENIFV